MHTWKTYLIECDSVTYIADISQFARNKGLTVALNRPGTFTFNMEMGSLWEPEMATVSMGIIVHKNSVPVWGGPLWTKQKDYNNNTVEWSAVGWFELLNKRILLETEVYDNIGDGAIAHDLLDIANDYHDTGISPGEQGSSANRDIEYEQFTNIGEAITNLTEVEAGFDFTVDPVEKTLDIVEWNNYTHRSSVLGYNWGPNNISQFSENEEADSMVNEYFVSGETATAEANDSVSAAALQLFQEEISISGNISVEYLGAIANAELAINSYPGVIYNLSLKPNTVSIFEDFQLGDEMQLVANTVNGETAVDENVRVFGASIEIDGEGNELVTGLQTTYQGQ